MKKTLLFQTGFLLFCILSIFETNVAQHLPNYNFFDLAEIPCPYDDTQIIEVATYWEAYQTLDNSWNGVIDSTICINVAGVPEGFHIQIPLDDIDPERTLFFRCQLDEDNKVLLAPNMVYGADNIIVKTSDGVTLQADSLCETNFCNDVLMGIQIPDSSGTGFDMRWHESEIFYSTVSSSDTSTVYFLGICLPTEKFEEGNFIREFVWQFTFDSIPPGSTLTINTTHIREYFNVHPVEAIIASYYDGDYYYLSDYYFGYSYNILMLHTASGYPSPNNISFVEATPFPNPNTQETVQIWIEEHSALFFQPHTLLRGGLVEGSDTLRHHVELVNNGGTLCVQEFAELVFENGDHYRHQGGNIRLSGTTSCMLFGKGGSLKVSDNTTLQYGKGNKGLLALKTGSTINIGNNAELVIHNKVELYEYEEDAGPQQIYMTLHEGSRLTFAPGSSVTNRYSKDKSMKLNVFMKGGIIDDSGLSESDKQLIHRIYPDDDWLERNLQVLGNPVIEQLTFSFPTIDLIPTTFQIFGINGQLHFEKKERLNQGIHDVSIPASNWQQGVYILKIQHGKDVAIRKVVKY